MKHESRKIPDTEKKNFIKEPYEYLFPSASQGDMTGLIPSGLKEADDIESYNEVYPYIASNDSYPLEQ